MALGVAGCDEVLNQPPPGSFRVTVEIRNHRQAPAELAVQVADPRRAPEQPQPGQMAPLNEPLTLRIAGAVIPDTVPPVTTMDVVVFVPPTGDWGLFVNGSSMPSGSDRTDLVKAVEIWVEIDADGGMGWGFTSPT